MNPAAGIMQQNKQAELGRREDRRQSAQQMMATLMTLFMQGKISREEMDARLQMAREKNSTDKDINAAVLQTHKDINQANIGSNEKMMGRQLQLQEQESKFRQTMVQMMTANNLTSGLDKLTGLYGTQAELFENVQKLQETTAAQQAKYEASLAAMGAKGTLEQLAKQLEANGSQAERDAIRVLQNTVIAGRAGDSTVATIRDGAAVNKPADWVPVLDGSGALGKASKAEMGQAILLAGQIMEAGPNNIPTKAASDLHMLLQKLGPDATHSLVTTLRTASTGLRTAGATELNSTKDIMTGTGPLPTPGMVKQTAGNVVDFQGKADMADHLAAVLAQHDPIGATLGTTVRVKNEVYRGLRENPTPGSVINQDFLRKTLGDVISSRDPKKAMEAAQGFAAASDAWGGSTDPNYYLKMFFNDMDSWQATEANPQTKSKVMDAFGQAGRDVTAGAEQQFRQMDALRRYNEIAAKMENIQSTVASLPPDQAKQILNPFQNALTKVGRELQGMGLTPDSTLMPKTFADMQSDLVKRQSDAANQVLMQEKQKQIEARVPQYTQQMMPQGQPGAQPPQQLQQSFNPQPVPQPTTQPAQPSSPVGPPSPQVPPAVPNNFQRLQQWWGNPANFGAGASEKVPL